MFTGFSPETIDFLWGLRMNNRRDWFQAHKDDYLRYLYEPMKALGEALFQPFLDVPGSLMKVSRIYKDARLHPPVPYKEYLWLCIRRGTPHWEQEPCLFLEVTPEGVRYGLMMGWPSAATMENFRRQIAAQPEPFLELIEKTEKAVGQPVLAECYKRPKPAENPALSRFFAWRAQIGCVRSIAPGEGMFGPGLKDEVAEFFEKLTPLYDYFCQISG